MLTLLGSATAFSPAKPNFLFVLADDLDFDYMPDSNEVAAHIESRARLAEMLQTVKIDLMHEVSTYH